MLSYASGTKPRPCALHWNEPTERTSTSGANSTDADGPERPVPPSPMRPVTGRNP
jgi:hypothetical protein